jgi:hypothetical protein
MYLEEADKASKHRQAQYEQINGICDMLKHIKSRKSHIGKKMIDQHLKYDGTDSKVDRFNAYHYF